MMIIITPKILQYMFIIHNVKRFTTIPEMYILPCRFVCDFINYMYFFIRDLYFILDIWRFSNIRPLFIV